MTLYKLIQTTETQFNKTKVIEYEVYKWNEPEKGTIILFALIPILGWIILFTGWPVVKKFWNGYWEYDETFPTFEEAKFYIDNQGEKVITKKEVKY